MKNKNSKSNKSNKNSNTVKRPVGAPEKTVKFPRGQFTVKEAAELNKGNPCKLTVIGRINKLVASGEIVKLKEPLKTKTAGRPSFVFMTKAAYDAAQARKKAAKAGTVVVTPISPEPVNTDETQAVITEIPAEAPAVEVETPVEAPTPEAVAVGGEPVAA